MDEQRFHLKFSRLVPQISDQAIPTFEFSDARAGELQSALRQFDGFEAWSESSRSFALLFMLRAGRDWTVLSASAFKDDLLPFPDEALRKIHGLSKEDIGNMLLYQDFFLAPFETVQKLELFKSAEHRPISTGDTHFGLGKELGKSKSALVRRARHRNSNTIFAIKMFSRKIADAYELFRTERSNLQKLNLEKPKHPHLIELIGTYTDEKHFALVLCPAAEYDLAKLLAMDESEGIRIGRREVLRYSFGCLASGLQYLHAKKIRHKDVKPGNILIHNGTVVICDFGISRDWSDDLQDFTNGTVNRQTHRYSSPEVSTERPRDAKADVWSLGCVFLEVVTVLKQRTVADLRNFFQQDPSEDAYYWIHPALVPEWTKELQRNATFNDPLVWIGKMLNPDPTNRPSAEEVLHNIRKMSDTEAESEKYVGKCCAGEIQSQVPAPPNSGKPQRKEPDNYPEIRWSHKWKEFADISAQAADDDKGEKTETVEKSIVAPAEVGPKDDHTDTEPPRPSVSQSSTTSMRDSNYDTQGALEKYFGYPSEVVNFNGTRKTPADILAFGVFCYGHAEWKVRQPIPGQTFRVSVSETDRGDLWERYRLLEINGSDGTPTESAWLPLRTVRVKLEDFKVELKWSDCNHQKEEGVYDPKRHWVFDPSEPNNHLCLKFLESAAAEEMRQVVLNHQLCQHQGVSFYELCFQAAVQLGKDPRFRCDSSHVHICRPSAQTEHRGERMIITEYILDDGFTISDIYTVSKQSDIDIHIDQKENKAEVKLAPLGVADYHSNTRNQPYPDNSIQGRFEKVVLSESTMSLSFGLELADKIAPVKDLREFLYGIFEWDPVFLAAVKTKQSRSFLRSPTDQAILLLFNTKESTAPTRPRAKIVFLFQRGRPDCPKWLMCEPVENSEWKTHGKTFEMEIHHRITSANLGKLLFSLAQPLADQKVTYKLEFEDIEHRRAFDEQMFDLRKLQKSSQMQRVGSSSEAGSMEGSMAESVAEQLLQSRNGSRSTASVTRSVIM